MRTLLGILAVICLITSALLYLPLINDRSFYLRELHCGRLGFVMDRGLESLLLALLACLLLIMSRPRILAIGFFRNDKTDTPCRPTVIWMRTSHNRTLKSSKKSVLNSTNPYEKESQKPPMLHENMDSDESPNP